MLEALMLALSIGPTVFFLAMVVVGLATMIGFTVITIARYVWLSARHGKETAMEEIERGIQ